MARIGHGFHLRRHLGRIRRAATRAIKKASRKRVYVKAREAVLSGLGRPSFDPFPDLAPNPERRARNLERPAATRGYAIIFTPRSGSSRLEEILACARTLSQPEEVFNPEFVPAIARAWDAGDMETYIAMLRRFRNASGLFGFEATWMHVARCFGSADRFQAAVAPDAWIWLIREDIVEQAVSISRMVQTRIAHNLPQVEPGQLAEAEARFAYSGTDIAARILAMRGLERGSEAMFDRLGARPLRLSYERVIGMEPARVTALIAAHVGATLPEGVAFESGHAKLGTDKNVEFARRFRKENRVFMRRIANARAPLLAALDGAPDRAPGG